MSSVIKSIAMVEPLGDYGIGGYAYELAEGLAANGVRVDLYTRPDCALQLAGLPRHHRLLPVLWSFMFRQRHLLRNESGMFPSPPKSDTATDRGSRPRVNERRSKLYSRVRNALLPIELAVHFKRSKYDLVWTQWPPFGPYGLEFWSSCKLLGMRVAHTVHNVLPHEARPEDAAMCESLYRTADFLLVHSRAAQQSLSTLFPKVSAGVIIAPLGLYTMFPRMPGTREETRKHLGIRADQVALLFFGGVRPYKNIDAVLEALQAEALREIVLIVAGRESGYDNLVPGEPLGRTRKRVEELGISSRVRLIEDFSDLQRTAETFEAADVVVLPYIESYGSALLLLAMTFGKFIVATRTGGMDEYLARYPRHILLDGPSSASVADGIARGIAELSKNTEPFGPTRIPELEWSWVARDILREFSS